MATDAVDARQRRLHDAFFGEDPAAFDTMLRQESGKFDINYLYGEPHCEPLLLTACKRHDLARVRRLLQAGADPEARDLAADRTALLLAAEQAHEPLLRLLLAEPAAGDAAAEETSFIAPAVDVNARNGRDCTALHLLVEAASRPRSADAALACLPLLAARPDADLGARDERGRSPLARAVELGLAEPARVLAEAGAELTTELRQRMEAEPLLRPVLAAFRRPPRARRPGELLWEAVHQAADEAGRLDAALAGLPTDPGARQAALDRVFGSYTCLQWAAHAGRADLAARLLDEGASAALENPLNPRQPLLYAAERGDSALVELLLKRLRVPPDPVNLTELRDAGPRGMGETAVHKAARHAAAAGATAAAADFAGCLRLLLAERVDVNQANAFGETALHLALRAGFSEGALQLLAAGASLAAPDDNGRMPVDLVRPETLRCALNRCVTPVRPGLSQQQLLADDCQMQIDFRCLAPTQRPQKSPEMPALVRMRNNPALRPVLRHPVIAALLYLKYNRVRGIYYLNLALFVGFTLLLTLFAFGLDGRASAGPWTTSDGVRATLTVGLTLLALREVAQLAISGVVYFLSLENLFELAAVGLGFPLVWAELTPTTVRHLSAWVMVFTWLEVAMSMGRMPTLARYKTMMESIALSFGKLIFLYFGLVIAFAIAFYFVFNGNDSFATFGASVPKAIAMATGEFDYGDLSETLKVNEAGGVHLRHVVSAVLLFICFLFLIFIVLMNLLTALAVDDTKSIMENAEVLAQDNRILLLGYIENFLMLTCVPQRLKRRGGTLREATESEPSCSGLKHAVRSRVLLFHSALSTCVYQFLPNQRADDVTCHAVAHACRQGQCDRGAKLCFGWLSLDGCIGEKRDGLCELPGEMKQQLLELVVREPTLEERVEKLQADLTVVASALSSYLKAQMPKGGGSPPGRDNSHVSAKR